MRKATAIRIIRIAVPTLIGVTASLTATTGVAQASPTTAPQPSPAASCPAQQSDLPPDALEQAMGSAVSQSAEAFPDRDTAGGYAVGATRSDSGEMAQQIIRDCGVDVQRRTVVVDLVLPAMLPDSSHTFGAVAVSAVDGGYQVWRAS
ncbi:hypothetical protein [Tomitella biformata]|uniref:hypothetical protein n=1 Tax=Tomitella biformata TaxID=630403 RepID=UPI00046646AF|nr:hypothetical protein [Tomitella biformata]